MDSILGALALGDIGKHFPDTDERFKGADSIKLLEHVYTLITEMGYKINNIDCTIIAQSPKMAPHIKIWENMLKLKYFIEYKCKSNNRRRAWFTGAKKE